MTDEATGTARCTLGRTLSGVLQVALLVAPAHAAAAPQTFNTALPVAKDQLVLREQFFYHSASDDPTPADRDAKALGAVTILGFGVTGRLAVFGALPYLRKELSLSDPSDGEITRSAAGVGDARLFGRYTIIRDDAPGRTFRLAPYAGLKMPTGEDDERDGAGRLPQPLQPGTGSWDAFGGIVATYQTLDYQIDAHVAYATEVQADGFEPGDEVRLDGSLQYRLWPRHLGRGLPAYLYGVIEANLVHREESRIVGRRDRNSGGTSFYISPGLQYVSRQWVVEAIVQVPLVQRLNGTALEEDFTVLAGFRFNFAL